MAKTNPVPRLSVQTQATPSTPGSTQGTVSRRLRGPRKNVNPGLFIANPDNSDEEVHHSGGSPVSLGERGAQRSPVKGSPATISSNGSGGRPMLGSSSSGGSGSIPIIPAGQGSPRSNLPPIPSIPAPQASPLPAVSSSVPSPQPLPPTPGPPQPPPQPERHLARSTTTPYPAQQQPRGHSSRPSLGASPFPTSPSRALPPLPMPSPTITPTPQPNVSPAREFPSSAPAAQQAHPPTPSPIQSSVNSFGGQQQRMASPEATLSPATATSDGSRGLMGATELGNRARSGSFQSQRIKLQVTTDNESFTTVDITGMTTAEGIKERVFSKLRFRDDEHLNLSLFRTDVDEQPDSTPVPADALLQLCQTLGDAKATLKFFVMHTVPTASRAAIVPLIADGPRINTDNLHAPVRSPSRHSREGSMSSASEVERGTSSSSWSEIQHDEVDAARRAGARRYGAHGARIGTSTGSSRSPLTPAQNAVELRYGASTPSPTRLEPPRAPSPLRRSQNTPTPPRNAAAGPSSSPGRVTDDGMDPATKALIESMQKEETEKEERRKRQLEADEELARREQQSERDVWEMMQELEAENETRRRAQIEQDEIRAREVQEEDRRAEDERAAQLAARTAWEAEQREAEQEDENTWMARPSVVASERRAKAAHWQSMSSGRETPFDSHTLPAIGGSSGTRRPSGSDPHYEASRHHHYPANNPLFGQQFVTTPPANSDSRQHGGYNNEQISEYRPTHPGQRQTRREMGPYHESLMSPSLQNARSMDSLRQEAPVSRPPFQAIGSVPPRSAITPGSSSSSMGRASRGRSQDGRYPDSGRPAPLHLHSAPEAQPGYVAFPTPLPRNADTTWSYQEEGSPRQGGYDRIPSPRPHTTFEYGEPQTAALPRRPSTLYDEEGPVARTVQTHTGEYSWRAGSVSAATQRSVTPVGSRRSTEPDLGREGSLLPYTTSPEHSWLSVPRPKRDVSETDTLSIAGTVSSQATTVRPRRGSGDDEEDSANTARADWASQLRRMIERGEGTLRPVAPLEDDEEEATLFISGPSRLETSPSRPNLKVNTADVVVPALVDSSTPSDSATESEGETRVHRAKSFRPPKDEPNQWHVRPEPEALYENLDNYFPKIDLDKPIVDGALSTPTTPASESPRVVTAAPPVHPSRQPLISSPKPDEPKPMPPPVHPARSAFNKAENRKSIRVMADSKRRTLLRSEDKKERINRDLDEKPKRRLSMWGHKIQEVTPSRISNWMNGQFNTTIPESPSQPEVENTETTITPSASSSSVKPTTLNWVKGELIGKGSYGRVYIALNVTTGDMMAVKQVELPVTDEDRHDKKQVSMVDALKSEIALLKDMYHPNIVAYLGCETSIDHLSIFLEYVPGGTIASIYRTPNQARFEEQLVKFFTQQILEGLAYLHRMNIWHRDLKGDNILVDAAGVCKISDFGISKKTNDAYDSFANATTMKGSVFWMAPEMIHAPNDEKSYSGKVDIWSLGCVVLEMWSGRRPWGDYEQVAAMFEMFNHRARPPIPADVQLSPPALDFLNERCLAKDPGDRPVAWELLKHPFITEVDPKWTFANSKIGKAVAKKAPKTVRAPTT